MPKVSVIIPVFGVEDYIERCARSLFEQSLDDIEFIFVNDCTKDNSISIVEKVLKEYPDRQVQTKIINHEVNRGLPEARKSGIQVASGDYIAHCDGDDWVDRKMYEQMFKTAVVNQADIVVCDYYKVTKQGTVHSPGLRRCKNKEDYYSGIFNGINPSMVWNKLINRVLYTNDITYPKCTHGEDFALIIQLLYYANKISYIDKPLYNYKMDSDTVIHQMTEARYLKNFNDVVTNVQLIENFYNKIGESRVFFRNCVFYLKLVQRDRLLPLIGESKYYKLWYNTFPEINSLILTSPYILLKHKLKYIIVKYHLHRFLVCFI